MVVIMNFHNYIAIPLETISKKLLDKNIDISANDIELGGFVAVMIYLLYNTIGLTEEVLSFYKKASQYLDLNANEVDFDAAYQLFNEFKILLNEYFSTAT